MKRKPRYSKATSGFFDPDPITNPFRGMTYMFSSHRVG